MGSQSRILPFAVLIVVVIILQLALIAADCKQTPVRVAQQFAKAYFYLDPDMQNYLCAELAAGGETVGNFLHARQAQAAQRGFNTKFTRHLFTEMHLKTVSRDEASAQVHISGTTRVAINPVFMWVGRWFRIGEYHPVEATIDLIKEDGRWRVCGTPHGITL